MVDDFFHNFNVQRVCYDPGVLYGKEIDPPGSGCFGSAPTRRDASAGQRRVPSRSGAPTWRLPADGVNLGRRPQDRCQGLEEKAAGTPWRIGRCRSGASCEDSRQRAASQRLCHRTVDLVAHRPRHPTPIWRAVQYRQCLAHSAHHGFLLPAPSHAGNRTQ